MKLFAIVSVVCSLTIVTSCIQKKGYSFVKQTIPRSSSVGIIVDSRNEIKNVIIGQFMDKGYKVKAINASDLYTLSDAFTIKDYKYLAYNESEVVLSSPDDTLTTAQKSFDSVYKLHVFNYETQKADMMNEIKNKWGVKYLIILDLQDWQKVSWARVIDLDSLEVIALENYPGAYSDKVDTIVTHFINTIAVK
jgi:hypothetical protein